MKAFCCKLVIIGNDMNHINASIDHYHVNTASLNFWDDQHHIFMREFLEGDSGCLLINIH